MYNYHLFSINFRIVYLEPRLPQGLFLYIVQKVIYYLWKYINALKIRWKLCCFYVYFFSLVGVCCIMCLPKLVLIDANYRSRSVLFLLLLEIHLEVITFWKLLGNYSYQHYEGLMIILHIFYRTRQAKYFSICKSCHYNYYIIVPFI